MHPPFCSPWLRGPESCRDWPEAGSDYTGTNQAVLLASGKWHMGALFLASGERFGSAWADSVSWTLLALGLGGLLFWRHSAARASREERISGGLAVDS